MKYPQLVSTKAVNEISDWLIKRLEDLDIEHPNVYSRLLLSLLHTPIKVNAIDLLEDLKEPYYRFTNKNNEELKRLAAVESLMEVSAEENKSSIISLVDELHSKLRKFESNCEDNSMNSTNSRVVNPLISSSPCKSSGSNKSLKKIKKNHGVESSTKNYYLAFPALNSNKKITTTAITSSSTDDRKPLLAEIEESGCNNNKKSDTSASLLSWSNLMTNKKDSSSLIIGDSEKGCCSIKTPTRRKRRYGKAYKSFLANKKNNNNDVQFTTKSFTMYDNATFSPKKMQMVKSSGNRKHHQRNQYDASTKTINNSSANNRNNNNINNSGIRNNNFSNGQNAPKMDMTSGSLAPWDMDFKGHWEMDRDLISEFIQQQKDEVVNNLVTNNYQRQHMDQYEYLKDKGKFYSNNNNNINNNNNTFNGDNIINNGIKCIDTKRSIMPEHNQFIGATAAAAAASVVAAAAADGLNEDEDDFMLMKFLPTKLIIDESLVDDPFNDENVRKPCNNKETLSISSLKSKFDANVKAIWGDDTLKPLTYKQQQHFEDDGNASLASSFTSEKNSLSLFNFNEQTHHFEVNAPCTIEFYQQHQQQPQQMYKSIDYDCNNNNNNSSNNNPMVFYGGRGAISKSSSFTASPRQSSYFSDQMTKSDFIKSGTNLQTSIWSDGGDFNSDAESLIFKEVADPKTLLSTDANAIYKNLSSIGAEMKQHWQTSTTSVANSSQDTTDADVTLFNHSEKSAFKKFRPLLASTIIRANYHPLNADYSENSAVVEQQHQSSSSSVSSTESENYLTSEKTHFSPIIRDGHTFVIDNNWDEIQWERSTSGGIMYKSKRYKIWNNNSNKLPNVDNDIDIVEMENDSSEFIIKYMLSENDKGCQTNESDFVKTQPSATSVKNPRSFLEINEEYCKRKIYDEYFSNVQDTTTIVESRNKWRYVNNNADDSNDYSFFTVNRVKNTSSQALQDILLSSNSSSSSICTITSSYDASESWRNVKVTEFNKQQQTCMHRLWEQCMMCAQLNEDPSLPANRLMKDELQLDGDEIMSVIQNLYITSDYCDDSEEKEDDCEEFDMNHVYMNMIMDDSMDGTCTIEDESKFYESNIDVKNQKNLASAAMMDKQLNLENFDEITLTQWQWNKDKEKDKDHEKYLKLLNWIKESLVKNNFSFATKPTTATAADSNNNVCQSLKKNRKRRHSTCQNFLENKRYHSHEEGFTYHLNIDNSATPTFLDDDLTANNLFFDAAKMLKVNIEKILLIHADPNCYNSGTTTTLMRDIASLDYNKDQIGGANYYRNILQQQHALIKQLDLTRPLTR